MTHSDSEKPVHPTPQEPAPEDIDINIEPPVYDKVTEGYDPSQVEGNTPEDKVKN